MIRCAAGWGLLVGLIASVGLAIHYRYQAEAYRGQLAAVEDLAHKARTSLGAVSGPAPAALALPQAATGLTVRALEQTLMAREGRIRQLEAALQNNAAQVLTLQQAASNRPAASPQPSRRTRAWLDDLKQSNSAQYEAITRRRDQARQAAQLSLTEQADYFNAGTEATLNENEQAEYQRMAQLFDDTRRLHQQLQADLPPDERHAAQRALRQNMHELEPLLETERSRTWYNLGLQLGYQADDARKFMEYLDKVIDLTSLQSVSRNLNAGMWMDHRSFQRGASNSALPGAHGP
ncbi:MAG: hypothetical protein L6455_15085 [Kiritimatiellae bacterium]|nr:hypothetical protein [Kiritimatiellia bacterium]